MVNRRHTNTTVQLDYAFLFNKNIVESNNYKSFSKGNKILILAEVTIVKLSFDSRSELQVTSKTLKLCQEVLDSSFKQCVQKTYLFKTCTRIHVYLERKL